MNKFARNFAKCVIAKELSNAFVHKSAQEIEKKEVHIVLHSFLQKGGGWAYPSKYASCFKALGTPPLRMKNYIEMEKQMTSLLGTSRQVW